MELEFSKNIKKELGKDIEKEYNSIENVELELAGKLGIIQEFSVDRIEGSIVILENRITNEKIEVEKDKIPYDIKEGDILKFINEKYILDKERTINETERIKDKMNRLWN